MPRTPDRYAGDLKETAIVLTDTGAAPTVPGEIRRNGDDLFGFDSQGAFNLRSGASAFACSEKEPQANVVVPAGISCFVHDLCIPVGVSVEIEAGGSLVHT